MFLGYCSCLILYCHTITCIPSQMHASDRSGWSIMLRVTVATPPSIVGQGYCVIMWFIGFCLQSYYDTTTHAYNPSRSSTMFSGYCSSLILHCRTGLLRSTVVHWVCLKSYYDTTTHAYNPSGSSTMFSGYCSSPILHYIGRPCLWVTVAQSSIIVQGY